MKVLIRKEIRLLLPAWAVAVLLAMVQGITRPYDFYVASLLFFGLTIMALSTIGRETSLNTFSSVLAQPTERVRIWQVKLSVLAVAFLTVFMIWLAAFGIAYVNSNVDESDRQHSYNLFIAVCLIATATFTGGLWTTLLLRQIAGAFWLTLLVPLTIFGFSAVFLFDSESNNLAIAVFSVVIGIYSIAGFFFARWLYFRAQDVGWSGGNIALPEWSFLSAGAAAGGEVRARQPIFALFKKELLLQQGVLTGAAGLLVLHACIIGLRAIHKFPEDSPGEIVTGAFWMSWLVLPALLGSLALAEERKLGVIQSQFCLPVSRRVQFVVKLLLTLCLGIILGGVMPMLLEKLGLAIGARNLMFTSIDDPGGILPMIFCMATAAWLTVVSFFASSLAKTFLQAIGIALVTFALTALCIQVFASNRVIFFDPIDRGSMLPLLIAAPTIPAAFLWLAYYNYSNFRDGWPLWRRNVLGLAGAAGFIALSTNLVYHRVWEVFEPVEPAHGPARLTLENPPTFLNHDSSDVLVRLPDGRVWFDYLGRPYDGSVRWWSLFRQSLHPLPGSMGPKKFFSGSNWVSAAAHRIYDSYEVSGLGTKKTVYYDTFSDSVGVKQDGTLWVSGKSDPDTWTADKLTQFGNETDWQQLATINYFSPVLLLKKNGTLWEWGPVHFDSKNDPRDLPQNWPGLRTFQPRQVGTNSDWSEIAYKWGKLLAKMNDGSVWSVGLKQDGNDQLACETNYVSTPASTGFVASRLSQGAYVRSDGSLWIYADIKGHTKFTTWQFDHQTNWVAAVMSWQRLVALKSDGTLWKWDVSNLGRDAASTVAPTRLGIHNDWVALAGHYGDAIAMAADGSLWFWPDADSSYDHYYSLLKLPKQPQYLGNVFGEAN